MKELARPRDPDASFYSALGALVQAGAVAIAEHRAGPRAGFCIYSRCTKTTPADSDLCAKHEVRR